MRGLVRTIVGRVVGPLRRFFGISKPSCLLLAHHSFWEKSFRHQGPTLHELAEWMIHNASAIWAINLDGGGSSSMAHRGRLVNRPLVPPWARPVATILCADSSTTTITTATTLDKKKKKKMDHDTDGTIQPL
jgi:Phosphodiester glycosidase